MEKQLSIPGLHRAFILIMLSLTCNVGYTQELVHSLGSSCVGSRHEFYWPGSCDVTQWYITGNYTVFYQYPKAIEVTWNSPGDVSITANSSCGSSTLYFTIQSAVTPTINISGPSSFTYGTAATYTASITNGGTSPYYYWYVNNVLKQSGSASSYQVNTLENGDKVRASFISNATCANPTNSTSNEITVTVYPPPNAPVVNPVSVLFNTSTTLTAEGAGTGEVYRWYSGITGGSVLAQGPRYTTPVLTADITYYISKYNTQTGAESGRVPQYVTIYVAPPDIPVLSLNTCGPRTLTRGTPPADVTWCWQGTNASGISLYNAQTYTVSSSDIYYIRARSSTGIWSTPIGIKVAIDPVDIIVDQYDPQNNAVRATHKVILSAGFAVPAGKTFTASINISPECNDYLNWNEQIAYGEQGEVIAQSRTWYSGQGKALQTQAKGMSSGKVFASQSLFDQFNQPVATTLAAPILEHDFIYKKTFAANSSGQSYAANDFDKAITTGNAPGEIDNPNPMGKQPGTIGWYYSANNDLEPHTPVTDFPYSRSYTPPGPDPVISRASSPGDTYKMGGGHESKSEREVLSSSELTHYLSLRPYFVPVSSLVYSGTVGYKYIATDANGKKVVSFVDGQGLTLATATYDGSTYDNWSYTYYNDRGQLVATVAPNGVNTLSTAYPSFVTIYKYDHLGRLIETTSPDEGTSQFVYSTDGKIRFSQNQLQRESSPIRFSYTNYDELGRLIESGEYKLPTTGESPFVFEPHTTLSPASNSILNIIDNTGFTGVTKKDDPGNQCTDYSFIEYDLQASDLPTGDTDHAVQENLIGQISKTENALSKTWYSYDEFGNLKWTKQYITDLGNKTVDYSYDYLGNVTEVAYQKGQPDAFYHYYTYDKDQRLVEVQTSLNGLDKTARAKYDYYLHGLLKRATLFNGTAKVQGIDYVYTINGALKGINHADNTLDPGNDGDDVFGQTITYHDNDYLGAGYSAGTQTFTGYDNQFSGAVKGVSWHSPADNNTTKNAYAFSYDLRYQFTNADFGNLTGTSSLTFNKQAGVHQESIGSYDKNGNIISLHRKGKNAAVMSDYSYAYIPNTNKLDKVDEQSVEVIDYTYNAIGQMIRQAEGDKVLNVEYNAYGLVAAVYNGVNQYITAYNYDDRGNRVIKQDYNGGTAYNRSYYVYDASGNVLAVYQQPLSGGTPQLAEVPIYGGGRIALYKPPVNTYFYEMSDHLGNVRAVIGLTGTQTYTATLEDNTQTQEQNDFQNYVNRSGLDLFDHTDAGTTYTHSQLLNGGYSSQVGLAKSFKVSPGDVVTASVYAKYWNESSSPSNLSAFAAALTSAFGLSASSTGEAAQPFDALDTYGSVVATGSGPGDELFGPKAFITILLFDANFNFVDAAWDQLEDDYVQVGTETKAPHDYLYKQVTIREPGYAFVFVSNEDPNLVDVFFDDLQISHEHSPIVAGADYYPFGLVMDGREITDEDYRYGYQGQYSEESEELGTNQFELRFYDAKIGRWLSRDPYGQYHSPYLAMGNVPHMGVDPDGGYFSMFSWQGALIGAAVGAGVGLAFDKDNWGWYALGGAAAGGFLASDFAKVEIWGTHRGLGNADALYGGGRENIARINHMDLKYSGKLFTGENLGKITPVVTRAAVQAVSVTQQNTKPVIDPTPSIKPGPPDTRGVTLTDGDADNDRPSQPRIATGMDVLQKIADHLKNNGGRVSITSINTRFPFLVSRPRVLGDESTREVILNMQSHMYKRLLFVHNTLISLGAPRGSVITTRTRFNYSQGNSRVGFKFD